MVNKVSQKDNKLHYLIYHYSKPSLIISSSCVNTTIYSFHCSCINIWSLQKGN